VSSILILVFHAAQPNITFVLLRQLKKSQTAVRLGKEPVMIFFAIFCQCHMQQLGAICSG